ncbi:hypothetical protein ZIOFF_069395 [Zingiber officinale]|uniref:40S ribosomal protein S8 n=1 Tax=Zingiber officinale TaxID=94328 RepID=A0A8J5CBN3_ZINOF|nr:hypothetical protein ZIOFF_069395 [Zingiber officinale]
MSPDAALPDGHRPMSCRLTDVEPLCHLSWSLHHCRKGGADMRKSGDSVPFLSREVAIHLITPLYSSCVVADLHGQTLLSLHADLGSLLIDHIDRKVIPPVMNYQQTSLDCGISRDSMHKRRATGGKKKAWRKKRKYELGRQPANTKLSSNKTVRRIRVRGGNVKWRALRLDTGNYSWGSEAVTRKTRILDVVYNASNNELVRTQTLVKSAIVQVDAAPFKAWYLQHYGVELGKKKKTAAAAKKETTEGQEAEAATTEVKKSSSVLRKLEKRQQDRKLDSHVEDQFSTGRLLAAISSRPGQCGRADGYILEGKELEFYMKKIQKKKGKGAA